MEKENIKTLTATQKKQLRLNSDEQYYLILPDKPQGGLEVDVILQNGCIARKITLARAMQLIN